MLYNTANESLNRAAARYTVDATGIVAGILDVWYVYVGGITAACKRLSLAASEDCRES